MSCYIYAVVIMLQFAREIVKKSLLSRAGAEGCFIVEVSRES